MGAFKMILYPFGMAFALMAAAMVVATFAFGTQPKVWEPWQNELVSNVGTLAGLAGIFVGSWLAIRTEPPAAPRRCVLRQLGRKE